MALAIFDLDETLIAGDSDHAWGEFIVEKGLAEKSAYSAENDRFFASYKEGTLDIDAYLRFVLQPLKGMSLDELRPLQQEFVLEKVGPMMLPKAAALIKQHRDRGDTLLIISATNELITAPIAEVLGVENLISSGVEIAGGRISGAPSGIPSFREGKVVRLLAWMAENGCSLAGSSFYSDSRNDLPLLEAVENPVAVDPDDELKKAALERGWKVMSLR